MSDAAVAKVRIDLREGIFEFDGSAEFVSQQLERYHGLIEQVFTKHRALEIEEPTPAATPADRLSSSAAPAKTEPTDPAALERHFGVSQDQLHYAIHLDGDGSFKILSPLKGSRAEQQRRLCSLHCLARDFVTPGQAVTAEELREACKEHSCYDQNNFASNLKEAKWFIINGRAGSTTYRLSVPGKDEARKLLATLVGTAA